jgi:alkylated DNA repair dioxygenase AlkB
VSSPALAWQASLLDVEEPSLDDGFTTVRRVRLSDGAWVDHAPGWLRGTTTLFERLLDEAPWNEGSRMMYGRRLPDPRLHGKWPKHVYPAVRRQIGVLLAARYDRPLRVSNLNLYRDGRDSVAWHGDRIARDRVDDAVVATISLGERRRFLLRPKGGGPSVRFVPGPGDLIVMGGTCQRTWEHTVPKVAKAGARVSITVRHTYS